MKNLKDTLTTVFGILGAISGAVIAASQSGITLPSIVITVATIVAAISLAIIGWANGKNADMSSKSPSQIKKQQVEK